MRIPELTTKAKVLIGLTIFVLLGGIVALIATSMIAQQMQLGGETYDFKNKTSTERKKEAVNVAQDATNAGDSKKGSEIYEQAIAAEPDPEKKVDLAVNQSRMLVNAGKIDEAIEVAKKAESLNQDKFVATDWLARLHERAKRYEEAAKYYEQAGALADSPTNKGKYSKKFYDREAARVKALAK